MSDAMSDAHPRPKPYGARLPGPLVALGLAAATAIGWSRIAPSSGGGVVLAIVMLNVAILLVAMAVEINRRSYSLHLMHLLCVFLFLGAPALFQVRSGQLAVAGSVRLLSDELVVAAAAVTAWLVAYIGAYELQRRFLGHAGPRGPVTRYLAREISPARVLVAMAAGMAALAYLAAIGLAGVTTRGAANETLQEFAAQAGYYRYGLAIHLLHTLVLRALPLVAIATGLRVIGTAGVRRHPLLVSALAVVGVATMLGNNPFAASRMWFVCAVFGVLGPLVFLRIGSGWPIALCAIAGLTLLPALSENRYSFTFDDFLATFQLVSPFDYLTRSSDVDSLGMTALGVKWVDMNGHQWGRQILGALFFWVPRFLWPGKPGGSGPMVTGDLGFEFTNLAMPIMAESYIDFGFGLVLVAVLLASLLVRADGLYWSGRYRGRRGRVRVIDVILPFWLGCAIYLTRGDLISAMAYVGGFSCWVVLLGVGASRVRRTVHEKTLRDMEASRAVAGSAGGTS